MKNISVIIPMWNKDEGTAYFGLRALMSLYEFVDRMALDMKVVIVDNASPVAPIIPDHLATALKPLVITLEKNVGFGAGVNIGAKEFPETEYICQMNSDCELVEDSLSMLIEVIEKYGVSVAMPESWDNCQHYKMGKGQLSHIMDKNWRFGAFWVMPRSLWKKMNGFDEIYKMAYYEDFDLWRRIEASGGVIAGTRGTWVKHVGGASSHPKRDVYFEKNRKLFEERWK